MNDAASTLLRIVVVATRHFCFCTRICVSESGKAINGRRTFVVWNYKSGFVFVMTFYNRAKGILLRASLTVYTFTLLYPSPINNTAPQNPDLGIRHMELYVFCVDEKFIACQTFDLN